MAPLDEKKITGSAAPMGRPPIGKFTAVRLSEEMKSRIDAIVGPGKRAEFIRESVEEKLSRVEQKI